jgi:hypothetical protein
VKFKNVRWLAFTLVAGPLALACSGSGTIAGTSGGSNPSDTQAAAEACGLMAGAKYKAHFVVAAGSAPNCKAPDDQDETFPGGSDAGSDAGSSGADAGGSCTTTQNGCTFDTNCTFDIGGYSSVTSGTLTVSGSGITGTSHAKSIKDSDGTVLIDCTYDITWTKE